MQYQVKYLTCFNSCGFPRNLLTLLTKNRYAAVQIKPLLLYFLLEHLLNEPQGF